MWRRRKSSVWIKICKILSRCSLKSNLFLIEYEAGCESLERVMQECSFLAVCLSKNAVYYIAVLYVST